MPRTSARNRRQQEAHDPRTRGYALQSRRRKLSRTDDPGRASCSRWQPSVSVRSSTKNSISKPSRHPKTSDRDEPHGGERAVDFSIRRSRRTICEVRSRTCHPRCARPHDRTRYLRARGELPPTHRFGKRPDWRPEDSAIRPSGQPTSSTSSQELELRDLRAIGPRSCGARDAEANEEPAVLTRLKGSTRSKTDFVSTVSRLQPEPIK